MFNNVENFKKDEALDLMNNFRTISLLVYVSALWPSPAVVCVRDSTICNIPDEENNVNSVSYATLMVRGNRRYRRSFTFDAVICS